MKISRLLPAFALSAVAFTTPSLLAADPATEARLLEALRQRLAEESSAPAPAAPTVTPAARSSVTRVVEPSATPAVVAPVEDDALTQRLREAVRARAVEVETQRAGTTSTTSQPGSESLSEALRQRMAEEPAPAPAPIFRSRDPQVQTVEEAVAAAEARQREAEARRLAAEERRARRTTARTTAAPAPAPAIASAPASAAPAGLQPVPLAVPASPVPATKEQQLAELLQRYKADEITPQEYHAERARILAQ